MKRALPFLLILLLIPLAFAQDLTFKDTLPVGTAKKYQMGNLAYYVEAVYVNHDRQKVRFWFNKETLTDEISKGEEYVLPDGSTIEPLKILSAGAGERARVEFLFFGTGKDAVEIKGQTFEYMAKSVVVSFDYSSLYDREQMKRMFTSKNITREVVQNETIANTTIEESEKSYSLSGEEKQYSSIGWLNSIIKWFKNLF